MTARRTVLVAILTGLAGMGIATAQGNPVAAWVGPEQVIAAEGAMSAEALAAEATARLDLRTAGYLARGGRSLAEKATGGPAIYCYEDDYYDALCLNWRFLAYADYAGYDNTVREAWAYWLTTQSGYLWFLDETNPEIVIKEIDGCSASPRGHWIFAAGLTNFTVYLRVLDLSTGAYRDYTNKLGTIFQPIIDQQTPFSCP